jgi:hypothetical protein
MARISLSWPIPSLLYPRTRSDARVPPNTENGLTETESLYRRPMKNLGTRAQGFGPAKEIFSCTETSTNMAAH